MENKYRPAMPSTMAVRDGIVTTIDEYDSQSVGLTKREHFAAIAMQGILSNGSDHVHNRLPETIAKRAIEMADALLSELDKRGEG